MKNEIVRPGIIGDPSLDHDDHEDPQKGATIGGIAGAVTGAVAGSMLGPGASMAGAVIGGILGAVTSKAAVGVIDKIEHEDMANGLDTPTASVPTASVPDEKPMTPVVDFAKDSRITQIPRPDATAISYAETAETPDEETGIESVL